MRGESRRPLSVFLLCRRGSQDYVLSEDVLNEFSVHVPRHKLYA